MQEGNRGHRDLFEPEDCICRKSTRMQFLKQTAALGAGMTAAAASPRRSEGAEKPVGDSIPPVTTSGVYIRMKSRDAYLGGVTTSDVIEITLADVLKFHGYCAGGVAFAFRAARGLQDALRERTAGASGHEGSDLPPLLPGGRPGLHRGRAFRVRGREERGRSGADPPLKRRRPSSSARRGRER